MENYLQIYNNTVNDITIFKKFDYLKLICDLFFCFIKIYKILFYKN